jgi:hypothetical protein
MNNITVSSIIELFESYHEIYTFNCFKPDDKYPLVMEGDISICFIKVKPSRKIANLLCYKQYDRADYDIVTSNITFSNSVLEHQTDDVIHLNLCVCKKD